MAWPVRAGIHHFMLINAGGEIPVIKVKIFLIPLATDLPPFATVASGEQTYTLEGIFIDTIGELYTNGN